MDLNKALALIEDKLSEWLRALVKMLPNIALAAIVIVLGIYLSRIIKRISNRTLNRFSHGHIVNRLISSVIYLIGIGVTLFVALNILNLDKALTSLLAGAGIATLALAFAFQDIAANFMSGILITIRRPLKEGDIVKIGDYMGRVYSVTLRDTVVLTFQGQMVIIPNKEVLQNPIENFSMLGKRRMDLTVGVSYGEDLEKVKEVTLQAVSQITGLSANDPITMFFEAFDDSSINYTIRLWVATPDQINFLDVRSQAVMAIKKAYDDHDITIPFPIRTLDFGIKGGQTLSEMQIHHANGKQSS